MSVPATNALPPAPRKVATRTDGSERMRSQASANCSYIVQVMALRALGRSNVTWAMPPSIVQRT